MTRPLETTLAALRDHGHDPKRSGDGWSCRCPAHDDSNPSLSISEGDDGRALIHCFVGCPTADVVAALGLAMSDLAPPRQSAPVVRPQRRGSSLSVPAIRKAVELVEDRQTFPTASEAVACMERSMGNRSAWWTYHDAAGKPVGVIVRWDLSDGGKVIRPVSLIDGAWVPYKGMPEPRPLYNLPAQANAERVYVCEGEKAADAAIVCGLVATTSAHGSNSMAKTDWSPLTGKDVVILPDHDEPGERYANDVIERVQGIGAGSVRVVRLFELWSEFPEGGDMADVIELAEGDCDGVRTVIEERVAETEPIEREPTPGPAHFEPFPVEVFPEPIRRYVTDGAKAIGCDPSYIALPMLSALASAIGNSRRIKLKRSWTEPAIIWTAIVGESGTAKSPALELALRAVRKRQVRAMREHADAMKAWEADSARWEIEKKAWQKKPSGDPPEAPEQPVPARTWTDDATIEALVTRLQENPRGLLMIRDELSGWFNFDRYSGGKGGGEVAKWLEVFGGRALLVDRKSSGVEHVPRASVSIAGGIQPGPLRRALTQPNRDNGLLARLLFAMPPQKPKRWTEDDVDEWTERDVEAVFERLYALEPGADDNGEPEPRLVTLSPEARRLAPSQLREWRTPSP